MSPSSRRSRPERSRPQPQPQARRAEPKPAAAPIAGPGDELGVEPDLDDDDDDVTEVTGTGQVAGRAAYSRLGPGAGIAYAIVGFIGSSLLQVGTIDPTEPADVIACYLVEERGRVSGGVLLTLFSMFFLLVFVAWLHSWLRSVSAPAERWITTLSLVGGVLMVATMSVVVLLAIGSTVLEDFGADPVIARTLLVLQWQAVAILFVPTAAFVGATGVIAYTSRVLPRWLAYSGMAIGFGLLIPPLAFLPFLLSTLWTGMLAVVLLQRSRYG